MFSEHHTGKVRIGDEKIELIAERAGMDPKTVKSALKNSQITQEKLADVLQGEGIGPDDWKSFEAALKAVAIVQGDQRSDVL